LICVGRLVTHKRVELLVDAAARLREHWPDLALHIVGKGPEHSRLAARVAELGLTKTVRLHGYLPAESKNALLAAADLHLSASEFEGWGLSVIEAASLGVPTVAFDIDGLRDAIRDGHTGWLAPQGEDLADTTERALNELADPVRRAEIAVACTTWAGSFSWPSTTERFARLITASVRAT
jgi:glycosyltransferase involved in cell wall biosynthesis